MKVVPITYHNKKYPNNICSNIDEVTASLDKESINVTRDYSLHTEYSHMSRNLNSNLINKYKELQNAHNEYIPQLWKSKLWAEQFAYFIFDLVGDNPPPTIIEIHPPFSDYCPSFEDFFERYIVFEKLILEKYPNVNIFIENRCGTFYRGGRFIISRIKDVLAFLEELNKKDLRLKLVLDYPQIFSAELIKMDNLKLDKILIFNEKIKGFINCIGGIHIWGKKKKEETGRWTPHTGDLNTFFSYKTELKKTFINSLINTFDDEKERYLVPEVNSGEGDLQSIIYDLVSAGISFPNAENAPLDHQYITSLEWINNKPYFNLYNSSKGFNLIEIVGLKNIIGTGSKRCIGLKSKIDNSVILCKEERLIHHSDIQCFECREKDSFKNCLECSGISCEYNDRLVPYFCNEEHYVYLAYFPQEIITVGIANTRNKISHLQKQGAIYALVIAKTPTKKIAKTIETSIVELGIKQSITTSTKIKHLLEIKDIDLIKSDLYNKYESIKENLSSELSNYLLSEIEHFNQYELYKKASNQIAENSNIQLSLFGDDITSKKLEETKPFITDVEIISVIGNIGIIKQDNLYKATNLEKLLGFELETIE